MIAEPPKNEKKTRRVDGDARWIAFLRRVIDLTDGRYLLTITKAGVVVDLTVTELGRVERIN